MKPHTSTSQRKLHTLALAAFAALASGAAPAFAAHDLPAGETGSTVASPFPLSFSLGTLLTSSLIGNVGAPGGAYTGSFASAVYSNVATAADAAASTGFTAGMAVLDFVYQFTNTSLLSGTSIGRLSFFSFANLGEDPNGVRVLAWDTAIDPDGVGGIFVAGTQAADNAQRGFNGSTISMNYGDTATADKIDPGESSFAVLLRVNTSNYAPGYFSSINGTSVTVQSFQPVAAIPEPQTYALMLAGLGAVGFMAKRRRRNDY